MKNNSFKGLLTKTVSFLGVATIGVVVSLPAFAQQSPDNPNSGGSVQVNPSSSGSNDSSQPGNNGANEPVGTTDHKDPSSNNTSTERVEGSGNGNQPASYNPASGQSGVTSGGQYNNRSYNTGR
jgi:hypothetical protein